MKIKQIFLMPGNDPNEEEQRGSGNADVIITMEDGDRYLGSIFTYDNIEVMRKINKASKEFLQGKYFWVKNMLLIDSLKQEDVRVVAEHLIDEGEFSNVFQKIN